MGYSSAMADTRHTRSLRAWADGRRHISPPFHTYGYPVGRRDTIGMALIDANRAADIFR